MKPNVTAQVKDVIQVKKNKQNILILLSINQRWNLGPGSLFGLQRKRGEGIFLPFLAAALMVHSQPGAHYKSTHALNIYDRCISLFWCMFCRWNNIVSAIVMFVCLLGGGGPHLAQHTWKQQLWDSLGGSSFQSTCVREHPSIKVSAHSSQSYVRGGPRIEKPKTSGSASTTPCYTNPLIITNPSPVLTQPPAALWLGINGSDMELRIILPAAMR